MFTDTIKTLVSALENKINHSILIFKLFKINVITTKTGGIDNAGGVIASISNLQPNTEYLLKTETTFHIYLYINSKIYAQWNDYNHRWEYLDATSNSMKEGHPSSFTYKVKSDNNGNIKIESYLCSAENHRYLTSLRYTVTWEKYNISQQTDWYNAWE